MVKKLFTIKSLIAPQI